MFEQNLHFLKFRLSTAMIKKKKKNQKRSVLVLNALKGKIAPVSQSSTGESGRNSSKEREEPLELSRKRLKYYIIKPEIHSFNRLQT